LKKPAGSVLFYKSKTEKIEPDPNRKKQKKNKSNQKKTKPKRKNRVKIKKPSQTGLNWFYLKKPNRTENNIHALVLQEDQDVINCLI